MHYFHLFLYFFVGQTAPSVGQFDISWFPVKRGFEQAAIDRVRPWLYAQWRKMINLLLIILKLWFMIVGCFHKSLNKEFRRIYWQYWYNLQNCLRQGRANCILTLKDDTKVSSKTFRMIRHLTSYILCMLSKMDVGK